MKILASALVASLCMISCSILKREDPEKDIKAFLTQFEKSLVLSDEAILRQFSTRQSEEAILSAIHVLQNKEMEYMECVAFFNLAGIFIENEGVRVVVPTMIKSVQLDTETTRESALTLWLKKKDDAFLITSMEGEAFYDSFLSVKDEIFWSVNEKKGLLDREAYFAKAREIQQGYDSVIWYANYSDNTYFYVVNGEWRNYFADYRNPSKPSDYKMGLVDQHGKTIVPVEFELVGTIGFDIQGMVEVKKEEKVGLYSLEGEQIIAPEYDLIVPHTRGDMLAIVRTDTLYGWIGLDRAYHEGLPNGDLERMMEQYEFLPGEFSFNETTVTTCEIPNEEYIGFGIVMPPSYWVKSGIFEEVMSGFTVGDAYRNAYTEYVETNGTLLERITDNVSALIISIKERYLEGREEFYEYERLVFVNEHQDTLATTRLSTAGKVNFKRLDSTLIELSYFEEEYFEPDGYFEEVDVPQYKYFRIDDTGLVALWSNRVADQTEFVKLDSSYITGDFRKYDYNTDEWEQVSILSPGTLKYMRDEILASYGFKFQTDEEQSRFSYYKWYAPNDKTESEIIEMASEIDKHNLDFLNRMIENHSPIARR